MQHLRDRLRRTKKNKEVQITNATMMHSRQQEKLKEIHMAKNNSNFLLSSAFDLNPEDILDKNIHFDQKKNSEEKNTRQGY